uniref:Wzz/FepE/Etk N-terminal domain-containing protein n=2 Tax=unclassified Prevotella TaxID=2638335 RepID=A0AB33JLU1_9BACT
MEIKQSTKEIDVIALILKVLSNKTSLKISVIASAIIGIIVALNTPKSYQANAMLAPELASGGLGLSGNIADMASNFGIELGNKAAMDAIYPELYPDVFASTDFVLRLFDIPIRSKDNEQVRTYRTHLMIEQKIPFWNYPKIWLSRLLTKKTVASGQGKNDPFILSKADYALCDNIRNSTLCSIDKKTSVITISVTDQDPLVAAIVADTLQSRLQDYITNYRTKKARTDYQYYKRLTYQAKTEYQKAQRLYASYADTNTDVQLQSFRSKIDEKENEMQLKYNIYTQAATQMHQALAKIQERTPAFTMIQKPVMPYKASSTPRFLIVLIFIIIGIGFDAIWVLGFSDWWKNKRKKNQA